MVARAEARYGKSGQLSAIQPPGFPSTGFDISRKRLGNQGKQRRRETDWYARVEETQMYFQFLNPGQNYVVSAK